MVEMLEISSVESRQMQALTDDDEHRRRAAARQRKARRASGAEPAAERQNRRRADADAVAARITELREQDQMSWREIAEFMEIKPEAIRGRYNRALQREKTAASSDQRRAA